MDFTIKTLLSENFYDVDLIDYTIEKYDHKRGFCALSADVKLTAREIFDTRPALDAWEVRVKTENGTLTL